jgi:predicted amidohydrolase
MFTRLIFRAALGLGLSAGLAWAAPAAPVAPKRLKIGIVQMARAADLPGNRDRIITGISSAAALGARVAVIPEGALNNVQGDASRPVVDEALVAIRRTAQEKNIYVVLAGADRRATAPPDSKAYIGNQTNWMSVIGPDGREFFRYEKLYDNHQARMPGVFEIDGIPCSTMICADRWLRGVEEIPIRQGARISFELSDNYDCEWVGPLGWFWYVPRALRNNVWVVLANGANITAGVPDGPAGDARLRHGHSAVIAPDGRLVAAAGEAATVMLAEIDVSEATLAESAARASHPALRPFWEAGARLQRGETLSAPPLVRLDSPVVEITLAVAQVFGDPDRVISKIREARARHADLVAFPARAVTEDVLAAIQSAARENSITVVLGAEHRDETGRRNSAYVIGPDGTVLTRYDQLSAASPFQPGTEPAARWFRVKGVPAVVSIGRDALWSELAELAAVVGAQIQVHLDDDPDDTADARLRRLQIASNMASFKTFTAAANVVGSGIWDDLSGGAEVRHIVKGTPKPDNGLIQIYSDFSANLVVSATADQPLIVAKRRVLKSNPHHPGRTSNMNPQMDPWYRLGADLIRPK